MASWLLVLHDYLVDLSHHNQWRTAASLLGPQNLPWSLESSTGNSQAAEQKMGNVSSAGQSQGWGRSLHWLKVTENRVWVLDQRKYQIKVKSNSDVRANYDHVKGGDKSLQPDLWSNQANTFSTTLITPSFSEILLKKEGFPNFPHQGAIMHEQHYLSQSFGTHFSLPFSQLKQLLVKCSTRWSVREDDGLDHSLRRLVGRSDHLGGPHLI